ncbi:MAG: hypothetical protein WEA04_02300 [Candidatus Andersenbacteria bacterium]
MSFKYFLIYFIAALLLVGVMGLLLYMSGFYSVAPEGEAPETYFVEEPASPDPTSAPSLP